MELVLCNEIWGTSFRAGSGLTNASGLITFENLPAGAYRLRTVLPQGYCYGEKSSRINSLKNSVMERQSAPEQESGLFHLEENTVWSAGVGALQAEILTGRMWIDLNGDGLMDEDEPPLGGQVIEMRGVRNGLIYQAMTDRDGYYAFTQLREGSYRMNVDLPDAYRFTKHARTGKLLKELSQVEGSATISLACNLTDPSHPYTDQNIGVYSPAALEGYCFVDRNGNGRPDPDEESLSGVTITLSRAEGGQKAKKTETGPDGVWRFENLRPGVFNLEALLPRGGYTCTVLNLKKDGNRFQNTTNRRGTVDGLELAMGTIVQINLGTVPSD